MFDIGGILFSCFVLDATIYCPDFWRKVIYIPQRDMHWVGDFDADGGDYFDSRSAPVVGWRL
jgi:hypothetical protein